MKPRQIIITTGAILIVFVIAIGSIPVTESTYQHIRLWGHALAGLAMGTGLAMVLIGSFLWYER